MADDEPFPNPPQNDDEGMRFYLKRMVQWADELDIKVRFHLIGAEKVI